MKICYQVEKGSGGRMFRHSIGVAFEETDNDGRPYLRVKLRSFPVSGELEIRDYVKKGAPAPSLSPATDPEIPAGYLPVSLTDPDDDIPF